MAAPTVADVVDLSGITRPDTQIEAALAVITSAARAYTRGVGFTDGEPNSDIAGVILTATVRLLRNPGQLPIREQLGQIVSDVRGGWNSWSISEKQTLDRYRVSAL